MKTILFMHQVSSIGGGSYGLMSIIKSLDRAKLHPIVCLASDGPLRKELEKIGVDVVFFRNMSSVPYNDSMWRPGTWSGYMKVHSSLPYFKSLIMHLGVDIVYLNNMMLYPYLKPAKECGCRTVLHVREHWPMDEHMKQLEWARKAVGMYADRLVAINRYSASMFPDKSSTVVYDWIDLSERVGNLSMDSLFGEDSSKLKIYLYMGGILRIKGAFPVISSFSKTLKDTNARLLVMGYDMKNHTGGWKWILKRVLFKLGFDINELKVRNIVEKDDRIVCVPAVYQIADILRKAYCNLSFFTMPHANLALAESIIAGTPIIAAKTDEAVEYSCGSSLSRLVEFNDITSFSSELARINEGREYALSNPCSDTVARLFSKDSNVTILNKLIEEL